MEIKILIIVHIIYGNIWSLPTSLSNQAFWSCSRHLFFHVNVKITVFVRRLVEIIVGNALNLPINFGRIHVFIIKGLFILKYEIFSNLLSFCILC